MISFICWALFWMISTESTAFTMDCAPDSATSRTCAAWVSESPAVSAFWCTVLESCCTLAAVCSRFAACCSVRSARWRLPIARLLPACATSAELLRTSATMAERLPFMRSTSRASWASSSLPRMFTCARRLPSAVCFMTSKTWRKSVTKLR
ncbi:hypothetical protein D9M68_914950 [compost metagenome]